MRQSGSRPACERWSRPGSSLRRARSPVAPNSTMTCGRSGEMSDVTSVGSGVTPPSMDLSVCRPRYRPGDRRVNARAGGHATPTVHLLVDVRRLRLPVGSGGIRRGRPSRRRAGGGSPGRRARLPVRSRRRAHRDRGRARGGLAPDVRRLPRRSRRRLASAHSVSTTTSSTSTAGRGTTASARSSRPAQSRSLRSSPPPSPARPEERLFLSLIAADVSRCSMLGTFRTGGAAAGLQPGGLPNRERGGAARAAHIAASSPHRRRRPPARVPPRPTPPATLPTRPRSPGDLPRPQVQTPLQDAPPHGVRPHARPRTLDPSPADVVVDDLAELLRAP